MLRPGRTLVVVAPADMVTDDDHWSSDDGERYHPNDSMNGGDGER